MLGQQVGSYVITSKLGEGGMGVVYLAEHSVMGKKAVVKVLRAELTGNEEIARRFVNEAMAAARIEHPGIVEVMDVGTHESGCLYILMELLRGETLAERIRSRGTLPAGTALSFARQAAGALDAAHRIGIVHRDLKPDNLFICPDPEVAGGERIKILDFGIAKLADGGGGLMMTRTGAMMGTPVYMSPEQCRGAGTVDHRSDLYALGCILFEMLCGRPPFIGEGIGDLISAHMMTPPPRLAEYNATLPAGIGDIVARLLEKRPEDRFQSCDELIAALDAAPTAVYEVPAVPPGANSGAHAATAPTMRAPSTPVPATTHSGATGQVGAPAISAHHAAASPGRSKWIGLAIAIAAVGAVTAIIAVALIAEDGDPQTAASEPGEADREASSEDTTSERASTAFPGGKASAEATAAVPGAAATGRGGVNDPGTAKAGSDIEPPDAAVEPLAEVTQEQLYRELSAAVSAKDYQAIATLFPRLDTAWKQHSRAKRDHHRARKAYIKQIKTQAARLVKRGKCEDLTRLAAQSARLWPEAGRQAQSSKVACERARKQASVSPTVRKQAWLSNPVTLRNLDERSRIRYSSKTGDSMQITWTDPRKFKHKCIIHFGTNGHPRALTNCKYFTRPPNSFWQLAPIYEANRFDCQYTAKTVKCKGSGRYASSTLSRSLADGERL